MNVEEFEHFFNHRRPRLTRAARRHLSPDDASDAAIAALHTMWTKNLPAPQDQAEESQTRALTFRILDGHVRNTLRARARQARLLEAVGDQYRTRFHVLNGNGSSNDWVERQDSEQEVVELIDALPAAQAQVVILLVDGLRVSEIAAVLGVQAGAVSMRINRARKNLRQALDLERGGHR